MFRTRSSRTLFIMLAILSFLSLFFGVADLDLTILLDGDADTVQNLRKPVPRHAFRGREMNLQRARN